MCEGFDFRDVQTNLLLGHIGRSTSPSPSSIDDASDPYFGQPTRPEGSGLVKALLQASHAECEPGTMSDLMAVVLNRSQKSWGFSYGDITQKITVWWGTEDEKISDKTIEWMKAKVECDVRLLKGEGHNLMTSTVVLCDVLSEIREESKTFKTL
jgi:hypothetical protein